MRAPHTPDDENRPLSDLASVIDIVAIQSLMDDFFQLTGFGIGIIDLNGTVLVATGWQDICVKFHRLHPVACANCIESDVRLSAGVEPGTRRLYKCKNNLWDMATPITVEGVHVANLFLGQFFFDDETIDIELFRGQARAYGFDEVEYLAALERVPRWSRARVEAVFSFYTRFASMVSTMGFSNLRLLNSLEEKETLLRELYHRTKNNMQVINSMLQLQALGMNNELVTRVVADTTSRIQAISLVHEMLYKTRDLSSILVGDYVSELVALIFKSFNIGRDGIEVWLEIDSVTIIIDIAIPCGLILNELITNSIKYAFPGHAGGRISISINREPDGFLAIEYADNGVGFPPGYDFRTADTLGIKTIIAIAEHQLGGSVNFRSGNGLACVIRFKESIYSKRV